MLYKALVSFAGKTVSMAEGEVKEVDDLSAKSLLKAGYIEPLEEETEKPKKKKGAKKA